MNEHELTRKEIDQIIFEKKMLAEELDRAAQRTQERVDSWRQTTNAISDRSSALQRDIKRLKSESDFSFIIRTNAPYNVFKNHIEDLDRMILFAKDKIVTENNLLEFKEKIKRIRSECYYIMKGVDGALADVKRRNNGKKGF